MTAILAPIAGWLMPLGEVADPVFASGSMGPGFAIDPVEGLVTSPCDGSIAAVAPTGHSVTVEAAGGATILIHVGLETVALKGEGFEMLVAEGATVRTGDPLIRFDLDRVALGARSLVTPVLVIGEGDRIALSGLDRMTARGEQIADASGTTVRAEAVAADIERDVTLPMPNGIHARPAARIVEALKPYRAEVALLLGEKRANGRSVVGLLKLAAKQGDRLIVQASGTDAAAAAEALVALIEGGMGEAETARLETVAPEESGGAVLTGVAAAPGLAIGVACVFGRAEFTVPEDGRGVAHERAALDRSLAAVSAELGRSGHEIARAHQALLDDPELHDAAGRAIAAGRSAAFAWRAAIRESTEALRATGYPLLIERVADLTDIERQVLARLVGAEPAVQALPKDAILIADDLLPSEFQALDSARLAGVALSAGGPTSHVAVLAASAGVPMLVALGERLHQIADGTPLILDASAGTLDTAPDAQALDRAAHRLADQRAARADARRQAADDARMADGTRIEIFANLGSIEDAARAVAEGAEGCGLLRTEFLFFGRDTAPDENEQARIYAEIATALGDRPLIVRTFDIGGDKPVPYLPMAAEENPALGLRGSTCCAPICSTRSCARSCAACRGRSGGSWCRW